MKIKVYKHIVMFLLPAALTGCSGKEDSLPGTGEAGLEIAGYNTLRNVRWKETSVYVTPKAIIKIGKLLRAGSCKKQPIK